MWTSRLFLGRYLVRPDSNAYALHVFFEFFDEHDYCFITTLAGIYNIKSET